MLLGCRRLPTDHPLTIPSAHPRHRTICPEDRPAAFYQGLAVKFTPLERTKAVFKVRRGVFAASMGVWAPA